MLRRRKVIDALLAGMSLAALITILVAIDGRSGNQLARVVQKADPGVVLQVRDDTTSLVNSVMEMGRLNASYMMFAGVAAVLVFFMLRMK